MKKKFENKSAADDLVKQTEPKKKAAADGRAKPAESEKKTATDGRVKPADSEKKTAADGRAKPAESEKKTAVDGRAKPADSKDHVVTDGVAASGDVGDHAAAGGVAASADVGDHAAAGGVAASADVGDHAAAGGVAASADVGDHAAVGGVAASADVGSHVSADAKTGGGVTMDSAENHTSPNDQVTSANTAAQATDKTGGTSSDGSDVAGKNTMLSIQQTTSRRTVRYRLAGIACIMTIALAAILALTPNGVFRTNNNKEVPAKVLEQMEISRLYVAHAASNLNGKWGKWHKDMITSEEFAAFNNYELNKSFLQVLLRQSLAKNVYVIYTDDINGDRYFVSINMHKMIDDFYSDLTPTTAMKSAWSGKPASDPNPWDFEKHVPVWTSYAPIYDRNAEIVALLALDYPVSAMNSYPEWNKSRKQWNGRLVELVDRERLTP